MKKRYVTILKQVYCVRSSNARYHRGHRVGRGQRNPGHQQQLWKRQSSRHDCRSRVRHSLRAGRPAHCCGRELRQLCRHREQRRLPGPFRFRRRGRRDGRARRSRVLFEHGAGCRDRRARRRHQLLTHRRRLRSFERDLHGEPSRRRRRRSRDRERRQFQRGCPPEARQHRGRSRSRRT